jgi:hypothetical protein
MTANAVKHLSGLRALSLLMGCLLMTSFLTIEVPAQARLSYPYAIVRDGKLYVGYADKHHHTAELAIIPVAAFRQEDT